MTNEQINTAIAEACGWTEIDTTAPARGSITPRLIGREPSGKKYFVPNFCNDLNAMHEAEKVLTEKQIRSYAFTLAQVLDTAPTVDLDDQFINIHATAAQRAEAFLRAIKKYQ